MCFGFRTKRKRARSGNRRIKYNAALEQFSYSEREDWTFSLTEVQRAKRETAEVERRTSVGGYPRPVACQIRSEMVSDLLLRVVRQADLIQFRS